MEHRCDVGTRVKFPHFLQQGTSFWVLLREGWLQEVAETEVVACFSFEGCFRSVFLGAISLVLGRVRGFIEQTYSPSQTQMTMITPASVSHLIQR